MANQAISGWSNRQYDEIIQGAMNGPPGFKLVNFSFARLRVNKWDIFRQFAMRNQNYGGGAIPEPSLTPSSGSGVSPMTPTGPRLGLGDSIKTSPGLSASPTPPTTSLLSLHPTNSALRAFGESMI